MERILTRTQFGNPVLRLKTKRISDDEILSDKFQKLIKNMYHTLEKRKYGVGLAAPQVGHSVAISAIGIKPTPTRPELHIENLTVINPEIVKTYGSKTGMWEACISGSELYAKVPRFKKVRVRYKDETAKQHEKDFDGFIAHVLQHEIDHLNGILFLDRVKDTKSYMTFSEYKKQRKKGLI